MKKSFAFGLAVLTFAAGLLTSYLYMHHKYEPDIGTNALPVSEFARAEEIIDKYYLRDYDMEDLQYAALKAMFAALKDPYTSYYTPEEYAALTNDLSGQYYGLGMEISLDEATGLAEVQYFLDGSPAQAAGVQIGDLIVSVDGQDVSGMTLQEISTLCVGAEGAPITIGVKRGEETLAFDMKRGEISRDMVTFSMLDGGVGYMRIVQFGGNCEAEFGEALDYFAEQSAKGIVIDLRNNPGGYLNVVVAVLDKLLPEGTVVYTEDKQGNRETFTSDASCIETPIVLLVNANTASAAEIFAGAVQDYDRGEVVGTTTYGKGVVQNILEIETGAGIKITSSQYFTPKGRSIDGNGIYPDVYVGSQVSGVPDPDTDAFRQDAQVNQALAVLMEEMS